MRNRPALPENMTAADYLRWVELARPTAKEYEQVRVVARSPSSPAGRLLMGNLELFATRGFNVFAVFTKVSLKSDMDRARSEYDKVFGKGQSESRMRFSNFRSKRDVRELLDIGKTAARLDDAATSLDALEVTSTDADPQTDFARKFAFDAIWEVSSPLQR